MHDFAEGGPFQEIPVGRLNLHLVDWMTQRPLPETTCDCGTFGVTDRGWVSQKRRHEQAKQTL